MSELGEIPSDWEIISLESLGEFKNGINKGKDDFGFGVKFVNIQDAYIGNSIVESRLGRLNVNEKEKEIYKLINGDIVVVRSSVKPEGVGYPILFDGAQEDVVYCGFMIRYRYNIDKVNPLFMLYQLRSSKARKQVLDLSTVSANTNINQESYKKVKIILPTKKEQEKIASILSTIDEQIDNVDALIEKNKELKKGLMQTLLTKGIGHTKFKKTEIGEIPEKWQVKKIIDIANTTSGGTPSRAKKEYYENGIYPWVKTGELYNKYISETEEYITEDALKKSSAKLVQEGAVIIAMYGATIGKLSIAKRSVTTNQACCSIICNNNICYNEYVYYRLDFEKENIINLGAGGAQPNISQDIIKNYKIAIPSRGEQQRIALILSEVDEKLDEYENRKQKLEELKRGLMQQLLTGKIRVI